GWIMGRLWAREVDGVGGETEQSCREKNEGETGGEKKRRIRGKIYEVPGANKETGRGVNRELPGEILAPSPQKRPGPPHPHPGRYMGWFNDAREAGRRNRPALASVGSTILRPLDDVRAAVAHPVLARPDTPDWHSSGA